MSVWYRIPLSLQPSAALQPFSSSSYLVADLILCMAYGLDSLGIQISSPLWPWCSTAPSIAAVSSGLKMLSVAR